MAALTAMADEGVVENARRIGAEVLAPGLAELADRHAMVGEVRGAGVFWAVELVADPETREPVPLATMAQLKKDLVAAGCCPCRQTTASTSCPPRWSLRTRPGRA